MEMCMLWGIVGLNDFIKQGKESERLSRLTFLEPLI